MGFQAPCQTVCGICKFFQTMHGVVSDPSFFVFIHRVAFAVFSEDIFKTKDPLATQAQTMKGILTRQINKRGDVQRWPVSQVTSPPQDSRWQCFFPRSFITGKSVSSV